MYTIPFLNPATYTVEVSATGFKSFKRENVILRTADKRELPIQLQIGAIAEEVTVSAHVEGIAKPQPPPAD
jgi:hypothetical protein